MSGIGICRIEVAGEELWLLPERAALWPSRRTLLVADPHFGKAGVFRARGIPVPRGSSSGTLQRLTALVTQHLPTRVVFLGDFFHGRRSCNAATLSALRDWRAHHGHLELCLVLGNHDRHAGAPPADLDIDIAAQPMVDGPFVFSHRPDGTPGFALTGHLHPAVDLSGPGRDHVRLPCFAFDAAAAVLPAFGDFTGHAVIDRSDWQRIFVVTQQQVFAL